MPNRNRILMKCVHYQFLIYEVIKYVKEKNVSVIKINKGMKMNICSPHISNKWK